MRPGWNDARQIILAGAVGIDVGVHLLPLVSRASEERNELGHATPQFVIGDLEVNDVDRDSSSAADLQGLVHGLKDAVPFVPNVGGIDAAVLGGDFAEGDEGAGVYPGARRTAQGAGYAQGSLFHGLLHQSTHLRKFLRRGRPGPRTAHVGPDLARPYVAAGVRRYSLPEEAGKVAVEIGPIRAMAVGLLFAPDWSGRTALPQNHRRDPLPDHAFRIAVGEERVIGVVVNVDEARSHGQTGGVDRAPGPRPADFAQGRNFSSFNGDVSTKGWIAGSVHN